MRKLLTRGHLGGGIPTLLVLVSFLLSPFVYPPGGTRANYTQPSKLPIVSTITKSPQPIAIRAEIIAMECKTPYQVIDGTCKLPPPPPPPIPYLWRSSYNHFPFGQCTWGVANLRDVPWYGNAANWYANSAPYRPRGLQPRVGAIMVTWESSLGHVALLNAVYPNGSFQIYEMNNLALGGWGRYNFRTLFTWEVPLIGFIY